MENQFSLLMGRPSYHHIVLVLPPIQERSMLRLDWNLSRNSCLQPFLHAISGTDDVNLWCWKAKDVESQEVPCFVWTNCFCWIKQSAINGRACLEDTFWCQHIWRAAFHPLGTSWAHLFVSSQSSNVHPPHYHWTLFGYIYKDPHCYTGENKPLWLIQNFQHLHSCLEAGDWRS